MNHAELKRKLLGNPETASAYSAMKPEFELLQQMLAARRVAGLSQADIASQMATRAPAVARLESSLGNGKHSPSLATLRKYAHAVGCELEIKLVKIQNDANRVRG